MPIYEYEREDGQIIEIMQKITENPLTKCPKSGLKVQRIISRTGIKFVGDGWYETDYKNSGKKNSTSKSDSNSSKSESSSSDSSDSSSTDSSSSKSNDSSKTTSGDSSGGCAGGCACH